MDDTNRSEDNTRESGKVPQGHVGEIIVVTKMLTTNRMDHRRIKNTQE
jgi:hypothetical protein